MCLHDTYTFVFIKNPLNKNNEAQIARKIIKNNLRLKWKFKQKNFKK